MRNRLMLRPCLTVCAAMVLCTVALSAQHKVRIIQTNAAGDNVHVIDPVTNKVVGVIEGIEVNHGAGAAPDGMLPSTAGLFLFGSDFHGPIWQAELRDWLALVVG